EHAIATDACAVVSRRDGAGVARTADASADGSVVVAAIAANPRNLGRRLIKKRDVALVGRSGSMGIRLRDILRFECRIRAIDQVTGEIAVSAIAGPVVPGIDREKGRGTCRKPCRGGVAPEILLAQLKAIREIPKTHGRCPHPKSIHADWTDASRDRMSRRQARCRVVNSSTDVWGVELDSTTPVWVRQ